MEADAYRELARTEERHWWFVARRRIVRGVLASLSLPPGGRILEFGSGTGGNLAMLGEFGAVTALEPEGWARRAAAGRHPGVRLVGSLAALGDERFDALVLLDVLEHLDRPAEHLRSLRGRLAPGAPLVLTVPAHPWLFGAHDAFLHHRRRYDAPTLRAHLAQGGFDLGYLSAMNAVSLLPAVAVRASEALGQGLGRPSPPRSRGMTVPPWPLNALLEACFAIERRVIPARRLPLGLSWIAIARPSPP